jgi:small subunit ribosomal protein S4
MARYTGADCRLCRREGIKLFLKGDRCYSDKCAVERRPYPPGQIAKRRPRDSEYRVQLREKQKTKRIYGLLEKQFRLYFKRADQARGITGENLLRQLELRLDNVVYALGFASSRAQARQLVRHGHIEVNGRKLNIPSYQARKNDAIQVREKSRKNDQIRLAIETASGRGLPAWLELQPEQFRGTVRDLPKREDVRLPIQEQLIVELYSK